MARWQQPGAAGFFAFCEDVRPMVPSHQGGYVVWVPTEIERREIERALSGDYRTVVFCWPRRHGKTLVSALIIVWRFLTRPTQAIAVVANSQRQVVDTAFRLVRGILEQTDYTRRMIDDKVLELVADRIAYPAAGSYIQAFPDEPSSLHGKRLNVAQKSELHAARGSESYDTIASSTVDAEDGLVLVDSHVGSRASPLWMLQQVARDGTDPSVYFSHIEYRDLEDAIENAPPWVNERALRSRAAQMLPAQFAQFHLNKWSSGSNALFPDEVIERCTHDYVFSPKELADGNTFAVGGGLDRAYAFSFHGDTTVTCAVLKTVVDDEPHFYVLASDRVFMSQGSAIRANFARYAKDFQMTRCCIEQPNSTDIATWASEQREFEAEVVFPSLEKKASAYTALYNAARDGRLNIHPRFEHLLSEMESFEYELTADSAKGSVPKFHHARGSHDDHLDALAWAVYGLRTVELPAYAVEGVHCDANAVVRVHCVLLGGPSIPPCSETCRSFQAVRDLYVKYRSRSGATGLPLERFAAEKVVNVGSVSVRR